jgi:hypothetical protein
MRQKQKMVGMMMVVEKHTQQKCRREREREEWRE